MYMSSCLKTGFAKILIPITLRALIAGLLKSGFAVRAGHNYQN